MASLTERLRHSRVRLSAQRRIIAECLDGPNRHITAEELLALSQERLPEIGRATVYKALTAFVGVGAVREVRVGDGPTRFDPNAHLAHHHLVCDSCGSVSDTADGSDERSPEPGFQVTRTDVTYYGTCATCSDAS